MEWIQPMEPVLSRQLITGPEWLHEIKWDGIRGMTYITGEVFRLFTKKGNERTAFYPELSGILQQIGFKTAVLDGEIIVLDANGNPSFYSSLIRERVRDVKKVAYYSRIHPVMYVLFDILYADGKSLAGVPLSERKEMLKSCFEKSDRITLTDSFENAEALYEMMKSKGWEGIVTKKSDSLYKGGKQHNLWYKIKFTKKMLAVIGGIQWKDNMPNSLILGIYKDESLIFIGKASTGLTQEQIYLLKSYYKELEQSSNPFADINLKGAPKGITWMAPSLTCWVGFAEFTDDGVLRHPRILGFSTSSANEANGKEYVL